MCVCACVSVRACAFGYTLPGSVDLTLVGVDVQGNCGSDDRRLWTVLQFIART